VSGSIDKIKWRKVQKKLAKKFGLVIGDEVTVRMCAYQKPVDYYKITVAFRVPYVREYFEVGKGKKKAVIAVLKPVNGCCKLCTNITYLGGTNCTAPSREHATGVCGSMVAPPAVGNACDATIEKE
jgi:hypothetical protein